MRAPPPPARVISRAMLVLIADKFPAHGLSALGELGLEVDSRPDLSADQVPDALAESGAEILIVRSTKVTASAFERGPNLSLVIRAGAGVNTIDIEAANARGVYVANCPGKNAIAVAELAMGHLMALDRNLVDAVSDLRGGHWNKKKYGKARGLYGRRLGLVGFGAIAREVAKRAQAFGMEVVAYDPLLTDGAAKAAGVARVETLPDMLGDIDALSVHVPYMRATHHLIGAEQLAAMKDGAVVIHTARGGVVDDAALRAAAESGRIRAGLDVYEDEPGSGDTKWDNPLVTTPGVHGTPHIGASTEQAQSAIAEEVTRIIKGYLADGSVANCVNVADSVPSGCTVVVRHHDRVGVLAAVLEAFRSEELNVQEMQNTIFAGNGAASATITLASKPSDALVSKLEGHDAVIAVSVRA